MKSKVDWSDLLIIVRSKLSDMTPEQIAEWNELSRNDQLGLANTFVKENFPNHYKNYNR